MSTLSVVRRVVETKARNFDKETLHCIIVYEPGITKEDVKRENRLSKRHYVLVSDGEKYEFKK